MAVDPLEEQIRRLREELEYIRSEIEEDRQYVRELANELYRTRSPDIRAGLIDDLRLMRQRIDELERQYAMKLQQLRSLLAMRRMRRVGYGYP